MMWLQVPPSARMQRTQRVPEARRERGRRESGTRGHSAQRAAHATHLEDAVDDAVGEGVAAVAEEVVAVDEEVVVLVELPELRASCVLKVRDVDFAVDRGVASARDVATGAQEKRSIGATKRTKDSTARAHGGKAARSAQRAARQRALQ